jgi:DNA-binding NarL/FixJ family response regulator
MPSNLGISVSIWAGFYAFGIMRSFPSADLVLVRGKGDFMSSISISNALTNAPLTSASAATNSAAQTAQPARATVQPAVTVRLSQSQQVYQLYNQGQGVSQIAANLSLSVTAVNSYLGIANSS